VPDGRHHPRFAPSSNMPHHRTRVTHGRHRAWASPHTPLHCVTLPCTHASTLSHPETVRSPRRLLSHQVDDATAQAVRTALRNNPEGTTTPHSVPTPSQHHHCCIATTNTLPLAAHPPHTPPRPRPLTAPTTMQPHHTPLPITPARSACRTSHTSDTQHMQWYTPPARHCTHAQGALRPKHSRMPSMPGLGPCLELHITTPFNTTTGDFRTDACICCTCGGGGAVGGCLATLGGERVAVLGVEWRPNLLSPTFSGGCYPTLYISAPTLVFQGFCV